MTLGFPKLFGPGLIPCDNYFMVPGNIGTSQAPAINLNYIPIWISTYCKVIEIGFNCGTLSLTNKAKVGIYKYDIPTANPTELLKAGDSEISFDTIDYKFTTIDIQLDPGVYYIGFAIKDATGSIRTILTVDDPIIPNKNATDFASNLGRRSSAAWVYANEMSTIAPGPFTEFSNGAGIPIPILKVRSQ